MIPLKDYNPTRSTALFTLGLIGVCVVIYFFVQPSGQALFTRDVGAELRFNYEHAAIPCEVVRGRPLTTGEIRDTLQGDEAACDARPAGSRPFPGKSPWFAVLYSMFLHGSLLHLGGNMLYLWVFGNNIEDLAGKVLYLGFYLLSGVAATAAHIAVQPNSTVPMVGASGAIAGVMGAYLVFFPRVPIRTLVPVFLLFITDIEARWLLGFWFVSQFFVNPNAGVAWMAHVGGFVFGALVALVWRGVAGTPSRRAVRAPRRDYY